MKLFIRKSAQEDLLAAAEFYDEQEPGLGDEVMLFLEQQIFSLPDLAGIHPSVQGFHRAVVQGRFPYYAIYYTLEPDGLHVRAVLDQRRSPKTLRLRLRQV